MARQIDPDIATAAIAAARESGRGVAAIPLAEIAARLGISRATLQRRIGSRQALHAAVRAAGVDPGEQPDVRERAVQAAAAIVRREGLGALTLERVAAAAGCSVPALHLQLGGREGLLIALFERFGPLVSAERLLTTPPATFRDSVRAIYCLLFDAVAAEPRLFGALLADALARPDGPGAALICDTVRPRVLGSVGRWLSGEVAAGRCRPLPLPMLVQFLGAPMALHAATRELVAGLRPADLRSREETIELFTDAYCRAFALPPPDAGAGDECRSRTEAP